MSILGDTKRRILLELDETDLHGYALAQRLEIPVTGVYQHLKDLEAEGLIEYEQVSRKKVYRLTEKGNTLVDVLKVNGGQP